MTRQGAREAIMTVPDGCYARILEDGAPVAVPGPRSRSRRRARRSARATPSWPATWPRATPAASRSTACASASPAAPSRPSTSAPGSSIRRGSSGCSAEVESERARDRRRDRLSASALASPRSAAAVSRRSTPGRSGGAAATIDRPDGCRRHSPSRIRPPRVLRCCNGSRDRPRKEGPPGLRIRRHRDRALAAHARPRRCRHHVDARSVSVRAAAAGGRARRRRLARDAPA